MPICAAPTSSTSRATPKIAFAGRFTERTGENDFKGEVDLTIRGVPRTVPLDITYLGEWKTPFWVGDENRGDMRRIGFEARTRLNRHDFGVSWQDELPNGGVVVDNDIDLILDAEAILLVSSARVRSSITAERVRAASSRAWPAPADPLSASA